MLPGSVVSDPGIDGKTRSLPAILLVLTVLAVLSIPACQSSHVGLEELLVASPHRDEIRYEIEHGFKEWYAHRTGREMRLVWLDLGGSSNIQKYLTDRLSKGPSAGVDVFFGGGSDPFETLKRQGNLVAYQLPESQLAKVPRDIHGVPLYDPDFTWYGVVLSSFGILYNKEVLRRLDMPVPRTWEDLGSTAYWRRGGGWVGSADPRHSSSVHVIFENILQAYGWEKGFAVLARASANSREIVRESSIVPRQVQTGEVACAPVIDLYAFSLVAREGNDRIGFELPEGETVITPDPAAIVRGSPNQALAEAFVCYLMSDAGQSLWMLRRGVPGGPVRYDLGRPSVLPSLYTLPVDQLAVTVNPFETRAALRYDGRTASRRWNALNDLIGAVLIDSQGELQRAWSVTLQVPNGADLISELTRPPCSVQELYDLADRMRQSSRERTLIIDRWMLEARQRYRSVALAAQRRITS